MTQEDLVNLFFAKGDVPSSWNYCFNKHCPWSKKCACQLSVAYKPSDLIRGYAIFPEAFSDGTCKYFIQLQLVKVAWGFNLILGELKHKDELAFRRAMTAYFGSGSAYYRYKLGQKPLMPQHQQYILGYLQRDGYTGLKFDKYTQEVVPKDEVCPDNG